jgi:general secretion pathway protein D
MLQSKGNTKLVASTQIHAFNNEDSSARIGQRVPVRSATFQTGTVGTGTTTGGVVSDVINYEQVGLTLKFKPIVFPNQDVQVAMEIESKDVAGAQTLTPTFTERTIKGTARVQNNKTLLLASVAQGVETNGRTGIPLLGLIPILGRLFTAPTKDNRQVDIVIAVTPRVIRAPAILPEDEVERATGSLAVPTESSLEAMIIEEDNQERLAEARKVPNQTVVQLPDQTPQYVPAGSQTTASNAPAAAEQTTAATQTSIPGLKPIDNSVKTLHLTQTADTSGPAIQPTEIKSEVPQTVASIPDNGVTGIGFGGVIREMKAGEKVRIPVLLYGGAGTMSSAVVGLKFDDKKVAVRTVTYGDLFGTAANSAATPFLNQNGKMYVSLTSKDAVAATGILAYIEIEALVAGTPQIDFDRDVLNVLAADGKTVSLKLQE